MDDASADESCFLLISFIFSCPFWPAIGTGRESRLISHTLWYLLPPLLYLLPNAPMLVAEALPLILYIYTPADMVIMKDSQWDPLWLVTFVSIWKWSTQSQNDIHDACILPADSVSIQWKVNHLIVWPQSVTMTHHITMEQSSVNLQQIPATCRRSYQLGWQQSGLSGNSNTSARNVWILAQFVRVGAL